MRCLRETKDIGVVIGAGGSLCVVESCVHWVVQSGELLSRSVPVCPGVLSSISVVGVVFSVSMSLLSPGVAVV